MAVESNTNKFNLALHTKQNKNFIYRYYKANVFLSRNFERKAKQYCGIYLIFIQSYIKTFLKGFKLIASNLRILNVK